MPMDSDNLGPMPNMFSHAAGMASIAATCRACNLHRVPKISKNATTENGHNIVIKLIKWMAAWVTLILIMNDDCDWITGSISWSAWHSLITEDIGMAMVDVQLLHKLSPADHLYHSDPCVDLPHSKLNLAPPKLNVQHFFPRFPLRVLVPLPRRGSTASMRWTSIFPPVTASEGPVSLIKMQAMFGVPPFQSQNTSHIHKIDLRLKNASRVCLRSIFKFKLSWCFLVVFAGMFSISSTVNIILYYIILYQAEFIRKRVGSSCSIVFGDMAAIASIPAASTVRAGALSSRSPVAATVSQQSQKPSELGDLCPTVWTCIIYPESASLKVSYCVFLCILCKLCMLHFHDRNTKLCWARPCHVIDVNWYHGSSQGSKISECCYGNRMNMAYRYL